jgi:hypothetical protein
LGVLVSSDGQRVRTVICPELLFLASRYEQNGVHAPIAMDHSPSLAIVDDRVGTACQWP